MKKIMFILALVMNVGLFASASNGKVVKPNNKMGKVPKKIKKIALKKQLIGQKIQVTVVCLPSYYSTSICCFSTMEAAEAAANIIEQQVCFDDGCNGL